MFLIVKSVTTKVLHFPSCSMYREAPTGPVILGRVCDISATLPIPPVCEAFKYELLALWPKVLVLGLSLGQQIITRQRLYSLKHIALNQEDSEIPSLAV